MSVFQRALIFGIFVFLPFQAAFAGIQSVYLTWNDDDTSQTMVVNFITLKQHEEEGKASPNETELPPYPAALIYYDTTSKEADAAQYRYFESGDIRTRDDLTFYVHSIELKNLKPKQTYFFRVTDAVGGELSPEYRFETLSKDTDQMRFVIGGDIGPSDTFEKLNEVAAGKDPDFAVWGGDIAYANGQIQNQQHWLDLFEKWNRSMVDPHGNLIPIVAAIGNHERDKYVTHPDPKIKAPLFFTFFRQAGLRTYYSRHFGKNVVFYLLDTGHVYDYDGQQLEWLSRRMPEDSSLSFRFAAYHVPLYPAYRPYEVGQLGREFWLPQFDLNRLTIGFEHHDHVLKRTHVLYNNEVARVGTVYLGDGCWGRTERRVGPRWYIEFSKAIPHVWIGEIDGNQSEFTAFSVDGSVQDHTVVLAN